MDDLNLDRTLNSKDMKRLKRRKQKYERELKSAGYEIHIAKGSKHQFAALIVIDPEQNRRGLLGPDGQVQWLDEFNGAGFGALADFVVSSVQEEINEEFGREL